LCATPSTGVGHFARLAAALRQSQQLSVVGALAGALWEMDFIQNVLNGMASRRPRLDALRDSWQDLDTHYDALETQFWQFYPRMMMRRRKTNSCERFTLIGKSWRNDCQHLFVLSTNTLYTGPRCVPNNLSNRRIIWFW
jgi:hypothetical protein